jgi:hypothetical protein
MASKDFYVASNGIRLIGGLEWRVLDANQGTDAGLRATGRERAASHAVTATSTLSETILVGKKPKEIRRVSGGFYTSDDESGGLGKRAHSLAAAFALWTRDHEKAALYVRSPMTSRVAVVVVLNGLPALDKVLEDETEAYQIVSGYIQDHPTISVFADDLVQFPRSIMDHGLLDAIAGSASKATIIKSIPADVARLLVIACLVVAALGGYQWWSSKKAAEEKKATLLRAQAADPIPKYLNELSAQRGKLGATRPSLAAVYQYVGKVPVVVDGWKLKNIDCFHGLDCSAVFVRTTGTYEGLKRAVPYMTLDQAGSMDLNEGRMRWRHEMEADVLDVAKSPFVLATFLEGDAGSQFQDWMVAGLGLVVQAPSLWPVVPDVPPSFKHPQAVAVGRVEVSSVPLPLVEEVISKAPINVIWSGFSIQMGEASGDPMAQAKVKLTGIYYVQN